MNVVNSLRSVLNSRAMRISCYKNTKTGNEWLRHGESEIYISHIYSRMPRLPTGAALRQGTDEVPCLASAENPQRKRSQVYSDLQICTGQVNNDAKSEAA
jgi:hypothetical protein